MCSTSNILKCEICKSVYKIDGVAASFDNQDDITSAAQDGWCPLAENQEGDFVDGPFCIQCQEKYMDFGGGEGVLKMSLAECIRDAR